MSECRKLSFCDMAFKLKLKGYKDIIEYYCYENPYECESNKLLEKGVSIPGLLPNGETWHTFDIHNREL